MAFLKRRSGNEIETTERELAELQARREKLSGRRDEAETELERALADRRRIMLEDDLDAMQSMRDQVASQRDNRDALVDAVVEIEKRIDVARSRLHAAQDNAEREKEAAARRAQANEIELKLKEFNSIAERLADALSAVSACQVAAGPLANWLRKAGTEVAATGDGVVTDVRSYCVRVVEGGAPLQPQPAPFAQTPEVAAQG